MIKITKPGQKEFHGFCKWCGCEFTYEISDLKLSATSDKLDCPTCGKTYYHPSMTQEPTIPGDIGRLQTWPPEAIPCIPDMTKTDPCSGCAWRENLLKDGLYIGDTPCTWCNKNKFNSITSSTPPLTGTVQGVSKLETYLTPGVDCLDNNQGDYAVGHGQLNACRACTSNQNKCDDTEGHNSCSGEHKCGGNKNCKGKH